MILFIATSNPGKVRDISETLQELKPDIKTLENFDIIDSPQENGRTLEENAEIKARFYGCRTGLLSLADDTGLEIDALQGKPGIYVRRWPSIDQGLTGQDASDEELISYTLQKMKNIPYEKRGAQFRSVIAIYDPRTDKTEFAQGISRGIILTKADPLRVKGFPFESLYFIPEFSKVMGRLTEEERAIIKHRSKAVRNAIPILKKFLAASQ